MRHPPSRSNRRRTSTRRPLTVSRRQLEVVIPAREASPSATASQSGTFHSSSVFGNFANARRPSPSRTDALGRAPPSEAPGMRSSRRSSSSSDSAATRSAAPSRRGSSTSGGTRVGEGGARKGPSGVSRKRRAPWRVSSSTPSRKSPSERARGSRPSPLCVPPFGAAQEHASPAVGGGIVEGAEQGSPGLGVVGAAAELQSGIQGKAGGLLQPARVVFKRGASAISANP